MGLTNVELYEALKDSISQEAARMIAEVVPPAQDLATKTDIAELRLATKTDIAELRLATKSDIAELRKEIADVRTEIHASTTRTIQWILGVSVPLFAATWGTVVAVLLKG